jgi:pantoate--beta-alanine ligase
MVASTAKVFETVADYRLWRQALGAGVKVGFVPTMGALHRGHGALMRQARQSCDKLVVSIFVNPLQFGPKEDFQRYPRAFERDVELCAAEGVDAILHPSVEEIYPEPLAQLTKVIPPERLVNRLCGTFRPGHFEGVATVVMKLFGIVEPTRAYFGEKDFQQLTVIQQMVRDLNVNVFVEGVPTVREHDGLALSSRNVYLTAEQRALAPLIFETLTEVKDGILAGRASVEQAIAYGKKRLSEKGFELQYLEVVDADTLAAISQGFTPFLVLTAVKLGDVRLIDNVIVR